MRQLGLPPRYPVCLLEWLTSRSTMVSKKGVALEVESFTVQ
jgi:hypothetical protein